MLSTEALSGSALARGESDLEMGWLLEASYKVHANSPPPHAEIQHSIENLSCFYWKWNKTKLPHKSLSKLSAINFLLLKLLKSSDFINRLFGGTC